MPELLTTSELARKLRVHPATVRRWVHAGAPVLRLPGSMRFDLDSVCRWLSVQPPGPIGGEAPDAE